MKQEVSFTQQCKRLLSAALALVLIVPISLIKPVTVAAASNEVYQVEIVESVSNGFTHPGIGVTKSILENARAQIQAEQEPWYSYFQAMTVSATATKTVTSSNASGSDPTKPASAAFNSQGFNSRFIQDGLKAYTQSLMYVFTGEEIYRKNAMDIIRIWSQMDPNQYVYFNDAHIHTGIPLNRMVTAAEILRYTSYQDEALAWTEEDTINFTNNLIVPVTETFLHSNNHFMNQHLYPLLGAMAGYIFTENAERYDEAVEWATVNKTALNQGYNGSIQRLFRLVDRNDATGELLDEPRVQHVEMGRDQAHGAGDLTNAAILARMLYAQGTKVDPDDGTWSQAEDSVGYYEFLDDRVLKAADYFWQFMLGYDTPWTPVAHSMYPDGEIRGIYYKISDLYKGRGNTALFWDMYYYYQYEKGIDVAQVAPYFYEAFVKRNPSNYYYRGVLTQAWESVDGGGDFWLYIPAEAVAEGSQYLPKEQVPQLFELEQRYTAFDSYTATVEADHEAYVQFQATTDGSKIAVHNLAFANRDSSSLVGIKFKSDGPAVLELSTGFEYEPYHVLILPDTNNEWKYITFDMGTKYVSYGQLNGDFSLVYMNLKGDHSTVAIDHFNVAAGQQLTPPAFHIGEEDVMVYGFVGSPLALDLSATDSNAADVISYRSANLPDGALLNEATGQFNWSPAEEGSYRFVVEATDGTTITTKTVTIEIAQDRHTAVEAITALHNADVLYESQSYENYISTWSATNQLLESASDEAFLEQLEQLKVAAENLKLLTPLLKDGSMDYSQIVTSTFGDVISLLVDNNDNSFPVYSLAPELYHIIDFGADYKVTAQAFGFEGRMNFDDRMAGITVFASNDGVNWTRITPGQTEFTNEMSVIEVDEQYEQEQYRLFKIQMIDPQPDVLNGLVSNLLELSELRIYGQRHESINKLEEISIDSAQSMKGRIVKGDSVTLTFKAKEPISNVEVLIQGQAAAVETADQLNFTAVATMEEEAKSGNVTFSIDYMTQDELAGDTAYFTTDGSKLFLADESNLIDNVMAITSLIDSTNGRAASETTKQTGYLFDNNAATFSDYRINGGGAGSYITFDFKEGNVVNLTHVDLLARQDQYYTRIRGAVIQGSNDNAVWTTISNAAASTEDWQQLKVTDSTAYRYIRIYNSSAWFGNIAEVKFYGEITDMNRLETVSISSEQGIRNRVKIGDTVTLSIEAKEEIADVQVSIQGQAAVVTTEDNIHFTAQAVMEAGVQTGDIGFEINYKLLNGSNGFPITTTSDLSSLYLADESNLLDNIVSVADLIDSTTNRSAADTLKQVNYLFDGNLSTTSDFRNGTSSGSGSYVVFDFKTEAVQLSTVEMLARQDQYYTRIKGAVVQGSNDLATWTNLTSAADSIADWQVFNVTNNIAYRYIRIYNSSNWFGNITELRLHEVKPVTLTGITVSPENVSLEAGEAEELTVTALYSNLTEQDVTEHATYATSDAEVATVSETGNVTAVSEGEVTITVSYEGMQGQVTVTVTSATPTPTPTPTASAEPTPTASAEPTPTASAEPTPTASAEPTPTASAEPTPTASAEPTPTSSAEPTPTASAEPTPTASAEPTPTASAEPTPTASAEPTPTASAEPTPTSSAEPTPTASAEPTPTASAEPTPTASAEPTPTASAEPTPTSSAEPTPTASAEPTPTQDVKPTPTSNVDPSPTSSVEPTPTVAPTPAPSPSPSPSPSAEPTAEKPLFKQIVKIDVIKQNIERGQEAPETSFNDVSEANWSSTFIDKAARMGIASGYSDGTFRPNDEVTRAEFATMIVKAFGLSANGEASFTDVADHWAAHPISVLKSLGLLNGYSDGSFRPNQGITRAEIVAILARLTNYVPGQSTAFTDVENSWAKNEIAAFTTAGILLGKDEGQFAPNDSASRAEAVAIIIRLIEKMME